MPQMQDAELADFRPLVARMRRQESLNCAVGDIDAKTADILLHPTMQPLSLVKELKKAHPKLNRPAHGVAFVPRELEKELHLRLGTAPAAGMAKRLVKRLLD